MPNSLVPRNFKYRLAYANQICNPITVLLTPSLLYRKQQTALVQESTLHDSVNSIWLISLNDHEVMPRIMRNRSDLKQNYMLAKDNDISFRYRKRHHRLFSVAPFLCTLTQAIRCIHWGNQPAKVLRTS